MFDIDIKTSGFELSAENIKEIMENVTFDGISKHCKNIKDKAKDCGIDDAELELYAKREEHDIITIHEELKDKKKFLCLKEAFEKILLEMPEGVKQIFEDILKKMEKKYS